MPDAEVIPIGAGGRPGRGSGRSPSAASRALAPASRTTRSRKTDPASTDDAAATGSGRSRAAGRTRARGAKSAAASSGAAATTTSASAATPAPSAATSTAATSSAATSKATGRRATRPRKPAPAARTAGSRRRTAAPERPETATPTVVDEVLAPASERESAALSVTEPEPVRHGPVGTLAALLAEAALAAFGSGAEEQAAQALAFLRRRITGDYEVDLFGFDRELTETVLLPALRPLYRTWFRVEVRGIENVPSTGGALIVANHSGTVPVDSLMTQVALLDEHPAHRNLRMLGADLVYRMPVVGQMARKSGATLACNEDAERLLSSGELVGVWPEGFKGVGKPFSERYKLQRFGRGGFVAAAMRTGAPIIPVSIVGAEEIYPLIGNLPTLARLLGVPYVPITPTFPWLGPLGLVPLPSKWIIEFGEPIRTDVHGDGAADDPMLVFNITDQVRETIQHSLYTLLMQRRSVFF